jgi:hypothetical protein
MLGRAKKAAPERDFVKRTRLHGFITVDLWQRLNKDISTRAEKEIKRPVNHTHAQRSSAARLQIAHIPKSLCEPCSPLGRRPDNVR